MHKPDPDLAWYFPDAISRKKRDRIAWWGLAYIVAQFVMVALFLIL